MNKYLKLIRPQSIEYSIKHFNSMIKKTKPRNPLMVSFLVTDYCNLRCKFCSYYNSRNEYTKHGKFGNMDYEMFKRVLGEIKGDPMVILTGGGEPTLHPRIVDIVREIKKKGYLCFLVTNGVALEEYAEALSIVDFLAISIDGTESVHDTMRNVPGTFSKTVKGVQKVLSLKKRPLVFINAFVSDINYKDLKNLVEYMDEHMPGIDCFNIQHLWFKSEEQAKKHNKLNLFEISNFHDYTSKIELEKLYGALYSLKSKNFKISVFPKFSLEGLREYYNNGYSKINAHAYCFWNYLKIKSNGDVIVCDEHKVGSVKESNLMDIWYGKEFNRLRKALKDNGTFPICKRCCELYKI